MTATVTTFIPQSDPTSLWVLTPETATHIDRLTGRSETAKMPDFLRMLDRIKRDRATTPSAGDSKPG